MAETHPRYRGTFAPFGLYTVNALVLMYIHRDMIIMIDAVINRFALGNNAKSILLFSVISKNLISIDILLY